MRKTLYPFLCVVIAFNPWSSRGFAASSKRGFSSSSSSRSLVQEGLRLFKEGRYEQAVVHLFPLSRRNANFFGGGSGGATEIMQAKYIMGQALMELKFYQVAAFQFVDLIRRGNGNFLRSAIQQLSIAADFLGDDALLNYAINKVKLEDIPPEGRDIVYFRLGEIKLKSSKFKEAQDLFSRIPTSSRYGLQARYNRGLAFAEMGQTDLAIDIFSGLLSSLAKAPANDTYKVSAIIGLARTYYQAKRWDKALDYYRQVPKDHELWHDALFESSWAHLRAAEFRSALSNFHSLHSNFYEEYYLPESLMLRSLVYLYICKYDEMEKVIDLYERTYTPMRKQVDQFLASPSGLEPLMYFGEVEKALLRQKNTRLPYPILNKILSQGDVKRSSIYLRQLSDERKLLSKYPNFLRSGFASYGDKVIASRIRSTKESMNEMVKYHLTSIQSELVDFSEQIGFYKYEMINGKKEQYKKKLAGKDLEKEGKDIDSLSDRNFYVQNGYEYWPFDGEYWLDEIGNYHYLGVQGCE